MNVNNTWRIVISNMRQITDSSMLPKQWCLQIDLFFTLTVFNNDENIFGACDVIE
jgi:hypothetical protein